MKERDITNVTLAAGVGWAERVASLRQITTGGNVAIWCRRLEQGLAVQPVGWDERGMAPDRPFGFKERSKTNSIEMVEGGQTPSRLQRNHRMSVPLYRQSAKREDRI